MWKIINIVQWIIILTGTIICAPIAMLAILISPKASFWFSKHFWAKLFCVVVGVKIKTMNFDRIRQLEESVIFCVNHQSNFDIIAIYRSMMNPIYFITKKELKKVPFLGWYITAIGMIFIDRSDRERALTSMKNAGKLIKSGKNVITFPEGTRSKNGQLQLFKRGSFIIAQSSNIKIIPIGISGSFEVNPPGGINLRPGEITVNFGDPINTEEYQDLSPEELANFTQKKVAKLIGEIH